MMSDEPVRIHERLTTETDSNLERRLATDGRKPTVRVSRVSFRSANGVIGPFAEAYVPLSMASVRGPTRVFGAYISFADPVSVSAYRSLSHVCSWWFGGRGQTPKRVLALLLGFVRVDVAAGKQVCVAIGCHGLCRDYPIADRICLECVAA